MKSRKQKAMPMAGDQVEAIFTARQDDVVASESQLVPPPPQIFTKEPKNYALADEDYTLWKKTCDACKNNPDSVDPLRPLASRPDLLSWRSPVTGQTLLHELAARGAKESTLQEAMKLGCENALVNSKGETAEAIARRKQGKTQAFELGLSNGQSRLTEPGLFTRQQRRSTRELSPEMRSSARQSRRLSSNIFGALSNSSTSSPPTGSQQTASLVPEPLQNVFGALSNSSTSSPPIGLQQTAPLVSEPLQNSSGSCRKKGLALAQGEKAKIAKASINLDLDWNSAKRCDRRELELQIQQAYGGSARVQIDDVSEAPSRAGRSGAWQNVKCRVMCDDASEARQWISDGCAQQKLALALNVGETEAVEFGSAAQVDDVDAVTLKLDSDSSSILCGACLLYNADDACEKIVCYSDRFSADGSVRHSGDTKVDGKSVHTISIVLSKVPDDITQLYFTLCSCGPADLSGFENPSIMLYQNSQPDANLLEYSINQAEKSASCVMARMLRQPVWTQIDVAMISGVLRKLRLPLLSIDLIMAMGMETSWSLQALGTEEWNIQEKICSNYHWSKTLIEERLKTKTSSSAGKVDFKRPSVA